MNSESLIFTNGHSFNKMININRNYYAL
ncbi:cobalamin biosynthesis protein P47K, partial [Bacillus sp. PIC28]